MRVRSARGGVVVRRVRLEQQARWSPGLLVTEVAQSDTRGGLERLPVGEGGVHLLVTTHAEHAETVEADDGPGLAEFLLER